jgi:hypothetical protein
MYYNYSWMFSIMTEKSQLRWSVLYFTKKIVKYILAISVENSLYRETQHYHCKQQSTMSLEATWIQTPIKLNKINELQCSRLQIILDNNLSAKKNIESNNIMMINNFYKAIFLFYESHHYSVSSVRPNSYANCCTQHPNCKFGCPMQCDASDLPSESLLERN